MRAFWRALCATAALAAMLLIAAGFLGTVHPAFDSFAHFRAHLAVLCVLAGFAAAASSRALMRGVGVGAIALGAFAFWTVAPFVLLRAPNAVAPDRPIHTLLQMNMRFDGDPAQGIARIAATDADIVTMQETTPAVAAAMVKFDAIYPYQAMCADVRSIGGAMILSKFPFLPGDDGCEDPGRTIVKRIDIDGTVVTAVSQHLAWPWPHKQWSELADVAPTLETFEGPTIIAGDFNAVPWSAAVQRFAALSGTVPARGIGPSWLLPDSISAWRPFVGLPIDNVLTSSAVTVVSVQRLAATASDHLPVFVRFAVAPVERDDAPQPLAAASALGDGGRPQ